jgi:hypothetical protein
VTGEREGKEMKKGNVAIRKYVRRKGKGKEGISEGKGRK